MSIDGHPSMFEFERPFLRDLAQTLLAEKTSGARVLDIGVGAGVFMAETLDLKPSEYTGLEINKVLVDRARGLIRDGGRAGRRTAEVLAEPWQLHRPAVLRYDTIFLDTFPPPGFSTHDFTFLVRRLPSLLAPGGSLGFVQVGRGDSYAQRHEVLRKSFAGWSSLSASGGFPAEWPHEIECVTFHAYCGYSGLGDLGLASVNPDASIEIDMRSMHARGVGCSEED